MIGPPTRRSGGPAGGPELSDDRGSGGPGTGISHLQEALAAVDPAAALVAPRIVRRAVRRGGGNHRHREVCTISGADALDVVGPEAMGLKIGEAPPAAVILIARPDRGELARLPRAEALAWCWRRLYQARVRAAVAARVADGSLDGAAIRERIGRIGRAEFAEARAVLIQDGWLDEPGDDPAAYEAFAAAFLELRYFAPALLPDTFPAIHDPGRVEAILAADVGADLLDRTRPEGAARTAARVDELADADEPEEAGGALSGGMFRELIRQADEASRRGNAVRAAILRARAARRAGARTAAKTRAAARAELEKLCRRLQGALDLTTEEARGWRGAIPALLERSTRGGWTAEARLLYDLQAACVDHERGVFALDPILWAITLGRRPLRRPLPGQREVLVSKHLRRAEKRLATVRLGGPDRDRLTDLLREAVRRAVRRLRDRFRPAIRGAVEGTGIVPRNLPERVALDKLVEELLDRIAARDYTTLGDLRDALARSNLKLPDLALPGEFVLGDRLLWADRRLAATMDGAHRRGEIYLRWLQRFSALAFGTRAGRLLTRFVVLPFGGAFVLLEGLGHLLAAAGLHVHFVSATSILIVGAVLLGLTQSAKFRRAVLAGGRRALRGARWAFVELPGRVLRLPMLVRLFESPFFGACWRLGSRPLMVAGIAWGAMRSAGVGPREAAIAAGAAFGALVPLLNSRPGRVLEEVVGDALLGAWRHLSGDLLPGLVRLVMEAFGRLLEAFDRLLYTVDEWLRFRADQGPGTLAAKAAMGVAWGVVAYVTRICVNLLIEPQVNPVKHFPVVTVSHKMLFPILVGLRKSVLIHLFPKSADAIFGATQFLLPGFFGFLVWELKENWRLYEANRPRTLRPVVVGHHGETMARFLRPGFHSGTVPKLFARLRRAERAALRTGRRKAALKHRASLEHVEEAIRHFVERDVLALLCASRQPGDPEFDVGEVALSTRRIVIELRPDGRRASLRITFEERLGKLIAALDAPDWWADLPADRRRPVEAAIGGLYRMAGVDLDHLAEVPPLPWARWVETWEAGRTEEAGVAAS